MFKSLYKTTTLKTHTKYYVQSRILLFYIYFTTLNIKASLLYRALSILLEIALYNNCYKYYNYEHLKVSVLYVSVHAGTCGSG